MNSHATIDEDGQYAYVSRTNERSLNDVIEEGAEEIDSNWKSYFSAIIDDYNGYCTDFESAMELIRVYLKPYVCQMRFYLKKTHHKNFGRTEIPRKLMVQWDDQGHGANIIPFDGVPFVYLNHKVWACHMGINKVQSFASSSATGLCGRPVNGSCPAVITMKEILKFPDYQITHDGEVARSWAMERLKRDFAYSVAQGERRFYIRLPRPTDHANHSQESDLYMWNPVNKIVQKRMKELIANGASSVEELQRNLYLFVKNEIPFGSQISENNTSYFPSRQIMSSMLQSVSRTSSPQRAAQKRIAGRTSTIIPHKMKKVSDAPADVGDAEIDSFTDNEQSSESWRLKCRDMLGTLISEVVDSSNDASMLKFVYGRMVECILVNRGDMAPDSGLPTIVIENSSPGKKMNKSIQTSKTTDNGNTTVVWLQDSNLPQCAGPSNSPPKVVYMSPEDVSALESDREFGGASPSMQTQQPFVLGAKPRRGRPPLSSAAMVRPPPPAPPLPVAYGDESGDYVIIPSHSHTVDVHTS